MSDKHLARGFEADLHLLSTRLLEMGGLVELQVARAMEALTTFDLAPVEQVIEGEHRLNAMEIEIDEEVCNIIARRQPAARGHPGRGEAGQRPREGRAVRRRHARPHPG